MKKLNKRSLIWLLSDLFIFVIIASVFTIGFTYKTVVPIYGSKSVDAVYRGNTDIRQVSFMVNVYENAEIVSKMIDVFNEYGAKATFFVGGCWADDNEKTLLNIINNGHEIGNHGYFHKDHKKLDYDANLSEISLTGKIVETLVGVKTTLFAPPSGSFSNKTLDAASDLGYKVIMWSKDTIDWRDNDKDVIYKRATANAKNGELILMHPKEHTLGVLPEILAWYKNNGFSMVTVSQNVN